MAPTFFVCPKKNLKKIFGPEKIFCLKNVLQRKFFGPKTNFCKKIRTRKSLWYKINVDMAKAFGSIKILGLKKIQGPIKLLVQNILVH